jgi:hypothetical protein
MKFKTRNMKYCEMPWMILTQQIISIMLKHVFQINQNIVTLHFLYHGKALYFLFILMTQGRHQSGSAAVVFVWTKTHQP